MKGSPAVIATLQAALPLEAHLNLQYRMDTRLLKYMGAKKIAGKIADFAGDEHCFLKKLTKQLLFIGDDQKGVANYSIQEIAEPATVTDMFTSALALEMAVCTHYEESIPVAVTERSDEDRNLMEHLVKWHHDHVRWLEKQLRLIEGLGGESEYLAEKL